MTKAKPKRNKKPSNAVKKSAKGGALLSFVTGAAAVYAAKKFGLPLEVTNELLGGLLTLGGTLIGAGVAYKARGGREGEAD